MLNMEEFRFVSKSGAGEFVWDFLPEYDEQKLKEVRRGFWSDPVTVANKLCCELYDEGIAASTLMFVNDAGILSIYDHNNGKRFIYIKYCVVMCGEFIIDLLHSNRLVPTAEYLSKLRESCENDVEIDPAVSRWYNDDGSIMSDLSIDSLMELYA